MREMKFRVWDRKYNRMSQPFRLGKDSNIVFNSRCICGVEITGNDFIYLQFTGLKDKNGQEIFEGDIIKGLFYDSLSKTYKTTICYVAWDISGYWTYKGEQDFIGGYLTDLKDVEVIGNMYENPELIAT